MNQGYEWTSFAFTINSLLREPGLILVVIYDTFDRSYLCYDRRHQQKMARDFASLTDLRKLRKQAYPKSEPVETIS